MYDNMTKFKKKHTIARDKNLLHSVVLVDGQAGCGKTLINPKVQITWTKVNSGKENFFFFKRVE